MAEPRTANRMRFTADTIEGLRDQLNTAFTEMAEQFETDRLVTRGVQFIPVRGPYKKDEAELGLMYIREYEFDINGDNNPIKSILIVLPNSEITKSLGRFTLQTALKDADGETQVGGLHD